MTDKEKTANPALKDKLHKANIRMSYLASYMIREYNHVASSSATRPDCLCLSYLSKDGHIGFDIVVNEKLECSWLVHDFRLKTTDTVISKSQFTNYNFKTGYAFIEKQNELT